MGDEMVTVYGADGCNGCEMTARRFERIGVPFNMRDVHRDPRAAREATAISEAIGSRQLPLVVAEGKVWSDFRPDRIDEVARDKENVGRGTAVETGRRVDL